MFATIITTIIEAIIKWYSGRNEDFISKERNEAIAKDNPIGDYKRNVDKLP